MTPRCDLCGEFASEETVILSAANVCYDCINSLVENEIERRGVQRDEDSMADGGGLYEAETQRMINAQRMK